MLLRRKLTVILATDVDGYGLMLAQDEETTVRRFRDCSAVLTEFIERAGGRIFNQAGDAILAEFRSAIDAVRCAIDAQESLRTRNIGVSPGQQMAVRIGITIGDVVDRDGDLLGDGVNIAARLRTLAPAGGICVSRAVHEAVVSKLVVQFADAGPRQLKNIPEPVHAFMISFDDAPPPAAVATTPARRVPAVRPALVAAGALALVGVLAGGLAYVQPWTPAVPSGARIVAPDAPGVAVKPGPVATSDPISTIRPEPPTVANAESGATVAAPAPLDTLTAKYRVTRQWHDCLEADAAETITTACRSLIAQEGIGAGDRARLLYRYGRGLRDLGETDLAVRAYTDSIALKPLSEAFSHRGVAHYDKGDFPRALADFGEALALDPRSVEAMNNRAWTLFKAGDLAKALADADRAVQLDAGKAYAWDTRAHINEARGERAAAISDYRKALSLDATMASSRDGLARMRASP
jgi:class 3 adenylate cyclase